MDIRAEQIREKLVFDESLMAETVRETMASMSDEDRMPLMRVLHENTGFGEAMKLLTCNLVLIGSILKTTERVDPARAINILLTDIDLASYGGQLCTYAKAFLAGERQRLSFSGIHNCLPQEVVMNRYALLEETIGKRAKVIH